LLKALLQACTAGGIIAAYKGKRETIEKEMAPLQIDWEAIPYKVPFLDDERNLLIIRQN
jgi:16S rRNA G527 N7-methylase RsmG